MCPTAPNAYVTFTDELVKRIPAMKVIYLQMHISCEKKLQHFDKALTYGSGNDQYYMVSCHGRFIVKCFSMKVVEETVEVLSLINKV